MNPSGPKISANARRTQRAHAGAQRVVALAALLAALGAGLKGNCAQVDAGAQAAAKSMEAKLEILESKDTQHLPSYPAVVVSENEANSYLKIHSAETLPKGVRSPSVRVQPEHVVVSAEVDFDELSRSYPNPNDMGPKILAAMFKGTQPATVTAKIQSESAGVLVQIESVVVGSTTVPSWLVDYVVTNVLQPTYKFDMSKPLEYPDHVVKIVLGSGQVTFLRGPRKQ